MSPSDFERMENMAVHLAAHWQGRWDWTADTDFENLADISFKAAKAFMKKSDSLRAEAVKAEAKSVENKKEAGQEEIARLEMVNGEVKFGGAKLLS